MVIRSRTPGWSRYAAVAVIACAVGIAIGMGAVPRASHAESRANGSSLEARVQKVEDENAIRELLIEYGRRLDAHDLEGYSQLFARDGEWIGGFGSAKGPAGILALMQKSMGTAAGDPKNVRGFHLLTAAIVTTDGDHATAVSKLVFFAKSADNKPVPALGGHYDDTLVRENGHWKFQRRVVMLDIPYQDPRDESTVRGTKPPI